MVLTVDSVIDLLIDDHRWIEDRLLELGATSDPEERRRIADLLVVRSVRHGVIEEVYLHPIVVKTIPHGAGPIAEEELERLGVERKFDELERADTAGYEFQALVTALMDEVAQHHLNEEYSLFPWVAQYADRSEAAGIGERLQGFEHAIPDVSGGPGLGRRVRQALRALPA
jgi:hemerythrin HHE cation binding domain-containing protein